MEQREISNNAIIKPITRQKVNIIYLAKKLITE